MATGGEVDNGEPSMSESELVFGLEKLSVIIGSAVGERHVHRLQECLGVIANEAGYSAHEFKLPFGLSLQRIS
jgi:hypothetical protein